MNWSNQNVKETIVKKRLNNVAPNIDLLRNTCQDMFKATCSTIYTNTLLFFSKIWINTGHQIFIKSCASSLTIRGSWKIHEDTSIDIVIIVFLSIAQPNESRHAIILLGKREKRGWKFISFSANLFATFSYRCQSCQNTDLYEIRDFILHCTYLYLV